MNTTVEGSKQVIQLTKNYLRRMSPMPYTAIQVLVGDNVRAFYWGNWRIYREEVGVYFKGVRNSRIFLIKFSANNYYIAIDIV